MFTKLNFIIELYYHSHFQLFFYSARAKKKVLRIIEALTDN